MKEIILASGSPRRKELLTQLIGDSFQVVESDFEENNKLEMLPDQLVQVNALGKARDVAKKVKNSVIIGADVVVYHDNSVLGKPFSESAAKEMLEKVRGKTVSVFAGLAVVSASAKEVLQGHEEVIVHMADYTDEEIDAYVATGEPLDKAGAFAIQEKGTVFVKGIEGDYNAVIGLPLYRLNQFLKEFDIDIFSS